jgi:hypothetical protein
VRDRATQEAERRRGLLVLEHLDVCEPGRVVARDVDVLPADPAAPGTPVAMDAVAGPADPAELLDLDVDELARPLPLVPVRRLERLQPPELPSPIRVKLPDTVEAGIANLSAISAPVIRNRRREAITATRAWSVRNGTEAGAEQRSARPCSPSSR